MLIQLKNCTPEVYYNQSRDFQLIGRLYDTVVNHIKLSTDMIYNLPDTQYAASGLIDLLTLTLGFKPRHDYNLDQLIAVCSILPAILKVKGTVAAVRLACQAILRAEGITDAYDVKTADSTNTVLTILIPKLQSITLLNDILDYILPAGMGCKIVEVGNLIRLSQEEVYSFSQDVKIYDTYAGNAGRYEDGKNTLEDRASIIRKDLNDTAQQNLERYLGDIANTILLGNQLYVPNITPTTQEPEENTNGEESDN